jgi:hypothetical protein
VRYPVTLRRGQALMSAVVTSTPIPKGKRLLVERVEGRRAKVVWPVTGWCSTHSVRQLSHCTIACAADRLTLLIILFVA